jgi:hypothetical protein
LLVAATDKLLLLLPAARLPGFVLCTEPSAACCLFISAAGACWAFVPPPPPPLLLLLLFERTAFRLTTVLLRCTGLDKNVAPPYLWSPVSAAPLGLMAEPSGNSAAAVLLLLLLLFSLLMLLLALLLDAGIVTVSKV